MTALDWTVLAGYFVLMVLIGVWSRTKITTVVDYFTTGGRIPWWLSGISHWGILLTGVVTMLYATLGGLWADVLTDFGQFVIQFAAGIAMFVGVMAHLDGVPTLWKMWDQLPAGHGDALNGPYTPIFLIAFLFIKTFEYDGGMWNLAQRYMAAPSGSEAKRSALLSSVLWLVWPLILFIPMWAAPLLVHPGKPEQSYVELAQLLLPTGLIGLVLAGFFSHTMAMVASDANVISSVVTRDLAPVLVPKVRRLTDAGALKFARIPEHADRDRDQRRGCGAEDRRRPGGRDHGPDLDPVDARPAAVVPALRGAGRAGVVGDRTGGLGHRQVGLRLDRHHAGRRVAAGNFPGRVRRSRAAAAGASYRRGRAGLVAGHRPRRPHDETGRRRRLNPGTLSHNTEPPTLWRICMPNITVELLSGRTLDQRREFVAAVTESAIAILGAKRESVRIVFTEIEKTDVANGGVLVADA
ncbi:sodium:solute symporter family transporter [Kribbella pittospori]|nr:tautomerase family protein [Kribbella pittospori]